MRIFHTKAFDGFLSGTGSVYTQTLDADLIASVERVTFGLVLTGVAGTSPTITVQFENSPDGTRWLNQQSSPELSQSLTPGTNVIGAWTNQASTAVPLAGYVRLRMAMGGTSPSAFARLWLIGRSPAS